MKTKITLAILYALTAVVVANWAIYLEILDEAAQHQASFGMFWVAVTALAYAGAAVTCIFGMRLGLKIGIVACLIALPLLVLAIIRGGWELIPEDHYSLSVEAAILMIAAAITTSVILLKRRIPKLR